MEMSTMCVCLLIPFQCNDKTVTKGNLGEERIYWVYTSRSESNKGIKRET